MKLKFVFSFAILFFLAVYPAMSQPGGGGPGDPDVPITGIEILLVAGGLLGARKLFNSKKEI